MVLKALKDPQSWEKQGRFELIKLAACCTCNGLLQGNPRFDLFEEAFKKSVYETQDSVFLVKVRISEDVTQGVHQRPNTEEDFLKVLRRLYLFDWLFDDLHILVVPFGFLEAFDDSAFLGEEL